MRLRKLARRVLPYELRLRVALLRRRLRDHRQGVVFATRHDDVRAFPHVICGYEREFVDYPGQGAFALAKRRNQSLLASQLHGAVIAPGETFSVWRLAARPTESAGYLPAAALKAGQLTAETGGAICLLSTVLYNIALLGALEIDERHCHSLDTYGERRYFELARDAAIEYGYRDLRFRNPHPFPVLIEIDVNGDRVLARLRSAAPVDIRVELEIVEPRRIPACWRVAVRPSLPTGSEQVVQEPLDGLFVAARRVITIADQPPRIEPLPDTLHESRPGILYLSAGRRQPAK